MAYSEQVMDHFTNPRNVGKMEDANGVGEVGNAKCGAAIATSSMATEMIKGKSVDETLQLTSKAVMEALGGLPSVKVHCSVLAEEAVKAAVAGYYQRQGKEPPQEAEFGRGGLFLISRILFQTTDSIGFRHYFSILLCEKPLFCSLMSQKYVEIIRIIVYTAVMNELFVRRRSAYARHPFKESIRCSQPSFRHPGLFRNADRTGCPGGRNFYWINV